MYDVSLQAMTRDTALRPPLDQLVLLGRVIGRHGVPHAIWSLIIFALYYLVPMFLCGYEGVLIGGNAASPKLPWGVDWLARHAGSRPVAVPYLRDFTQLLMALVISVGGAVAITALDRFPQVYASIADTELLKVDERELADQRARTNRQMGVRWVVILFAVIAALCGAAFYSDGKLATGWWGNPAYGPAGLVLSVTIPLALFYGTHTLYLLAVGQHSISKLINAGIKLRPFHPDGLNGFAVLGNYLLLLIALSILCALAAWITLWHGYLGVEDFPGIWLGAIAVVTFIPWMVIQPLMHVTREIRRAQIAHLASVERLLNAVLAKTEAQLADPDFRISDVSELKTLHDLHTVASDIYLTNVFPFNRKVASVLSIGYVLQVITLIKEISSKFK